MIIKLVKKVTEVAQDTESKFFSLREWYNKYVPSWGAEPENTDTVDTISKVIEHSSIFHSWLFWLGMVFVVAVFGSLIYFDNPVKSSVKSVFKGDDHDYSHPMMDKPNVFKRFYNWVFNRDSNIRTPVNNRSESASNNNSSESLGIDEEIAHAITPDSPEVRKGVRAFFSRIFNRNLQPAELPSVPHNEPWTSPLERFRQFKKYYISCFKIKRVH